MAGVDSSGELASILTPSDEVQYWADMANTASRRDLRQMASDFHSVLDPLAKEFANIDSLAQLQVKTNPFFLLLSDLQNEILIKIRKYNQNLTKFQIGTETLRSEKRFLKFRSPE